MSFILEGTFESIIDSEMGKIVRGVRRWERNLRRLTLQGYSPVRAAYMLNGSPNGPTSRGVKLWFIRRKNADRDFQRRMAKYER